jgi:hypothetical protein
LNPLAERTCFPQAWTCLDGHEVDSKKLKLSDLDLEGTFTLASCEAACNGVTSRRRVCH